MEIWKKIEGFENYQVSITGLIRKDNKILKPYHAKKTDFHLKIKLSKNGIRKAFYVHQIVAAAFIPNPEKLPEINHIDHNPENNSVTNLEWIDHQNNCKDAAEFKAVKKIIENPHLDIISEHELFTKKIKIAGE